MKKEGKKKISQCVWTLTRGQHHQDFTVRLFRGQKSSSTLRSGHFLPLYPFIQYNILLEVSAELTVAMTQTWDACRPSTPDLPEDQDRWVLFSLKQIKNNPGKLLAWRPNVLNIAGVQQGTANDVFTSMGAREDPILVLQQKAKQFVLPSFLNCFHQHQHAPWMPRSSPERRLRFPTNHCCIPAPKLSPSFAELPDHPTLLISIFCGILRPWSHTADGEAALPVAWHLLTMQAVHSIIHTGLFSCVVQLWEPAAQWAQHGKNFGWKCFFFFFCPLLWLSLAFSSCTIVKASFSAVKM